MSSMRYFPAFSVYTVKAGVTSTKFGGSLTATGLVMV